MELDKTFLKSDIVLPPDLEAGVLDDLPEKVLQFGEGAFLRAFFDWMIDKANQQGVFNGRAVIVQPIPEGRIEDLNRQDGLYTLLLRGVDQGRVVEKKRIITSISRGVNPYTDWPGFLACVENPDLRIMVSNTTEAGIAYLKEDFVEGRPLESFPGKLTALLYHRYQCFNGSPDKGFLVFPCELIDQNGSNLERIVLRLAEEWILPGEFISWIKEHNHFFNTLVDRIVTGYPGSEVDELAESLGYDDSLMDAGEYFHLWVIEGDSRFKSELPLDQAGLNVFWTDNLKPFRDRKVRVLNGAHTMTAAVAYLSGLDTVKEAVEDKVVGRFMSRGIFEEILPHLDLPDKEKQAFAAAVLERFKNPFIRHQWIDISLNSISKFKTRCLPTILDYIKTHNDAPGLMSFALAALIVLYRGKTMSSGKLEAYRGDDPYLISDDRRVIEFFAGCWAEFVEAENSNPDRLTKMILGAKEFWGTDLTTLPGLSKAVAASLDKILNLGLPQALEELLAEN